MRKRSATVPKPDWHRPGIRVNIYFPDHTTLRDLDREAAKSKHTRYSLIKVMLAERRGAA